MGKNMKERLTQRKYVILFVLIIIAQITVMAFYENSKQFYHIDEIYSFESAHNIMLYSFNEDGFRIFNQDNWYNQWHSKEEFMEHFEVQDEQSLFKYSLPDFLKYKKSGNIYMYALNLVCSLQKDPIPCKWSGFVLNCILFLIAQIFVYKLVYEITKKEEESLLAILLYGFSAGAISLTIYIRFYDLCLLCAVLITYFHIKIWKCTKIWQTMLYLIGVAASVVVVCSYQPYMLSYSGCVVIAFVLISIVTKKYKIILQYIGLILTGSVLSLLVYPQIWYTILSMANSEYGKITIDNLFGKTNNEFKQFVEYYFHKVLSHTLAGGTGALIVCGVLLILFIYAAIAKKIKTVNIDNNISYKIFLLLITLMFFGLQCRILDGMTYRYMSYCYPIVCVLVAMAIYYILDICDLKKKYLWFAIIVMTQVIMVYVKGYVDELYLQAREMKETLANYEECDSVLFIEARHAHQYYRDAFLLPEGTEFCAVESLDALEMDYTFMDRQNGKAMLCWFPNFEWNDEINDYKALDRIVNMTKYSSYYKVLETYQSTVYYLY